MRACFVGFFSDKPHSEWHKGVQEGCDDLGIDYDLADAKIGDKGAVSLSLGSGYDVLVLLWYDGTITDEGWAALKTRAKKVGLWYPDQYTARWGSAKALRENLDAIFITNTAMTDYYLSQTGVNTHFVPQACLDRPFVQDLNPTIDVGFCGTRWHKEKGDYVVWERTKALSIMSAFYPITYYPADGLYDHSNFPGALNFYRSCKVNLAINRYRDVAHSQSIRTWNILSSSSLAVTNASTGLDDLFNGTVRSFRTNDGYKRLVLEYVNNQKARDDARRSQWECGQEKHLYRHRIKRILEILS